MTPDIETLIERLQSIAYHHCLTGPSKAAIEDAITALRAVQWRPISEAPKDGFFLVTDGERCMVMSGRMLATSLLPGTPKRFSGQHWVAWMALPPLPAARASKEG